MNFGQAVEELKLGNKVTRKCWDRSNAKVCIALQVPDENSFMTESYMYLDIDGKVRHPLELTNDLVLAEDFYSLDMSEDIVKESMDEVHEELALKIIDNDDHPINPDLEECETESCGEESTECGA